MSFSRYNWWNYNLRVEGVDPGNACHDRDGAIYAMRQRPLLFPLALEEFEHRRVVSRCTAGSSIFTPAPRFGEVLLDDARYPPSTARNTNPRGITFEWQRAARFLSKEIMPGDRRHRAQRRRFYGTGSNLNDGTPTCYRCDISLRAAAACAQRRRSPTSGTGNLWQLYIITWALLPTRRGVVQRRGSAVRIA